MNDGQKSNHLSTRGSDHEMCRYKPLEINTSMEASSRFLELPEWSIDTLRFNHGNFMRVDPNMECVCRKRDRLHISYAVVERTPVWRDHNDTSLH